ncbi:MAG TPA: polysaccharide biosynthesis/export family protein, partial [Fluviicola sp.]|nr:polysaccharide biosynthesis/export family protein [Fluviicola sp.]
CNRKTLRMYKLFLISLVIIALTSCNIRKNVVYFQTTSTDTTQNNYTPVFKTDDLLSITVLADDPETAIPFNLPSMNNSMNTNSGYSQGNPERSGYLIDENGFVHLPIIGNVSIAGLSRSEAIQLLESKYKSYLSNPIVHIQLLNFKITVLGEVENPGTFKIPNERITLLEAIGLAGDLKITGKRLNLLIIRDKNGVKEQYRVNLTKSEEIFNSPIYYLQQNDVVYIEPNIASRTNGSFWKTSAPIFISTAAVIISTISVIAK